MDKVSVIIPAYNVEKYIHRAIESVISQTYSNVELVIVDDGSNDKTWEVIQDYARLNPTIKALHQNNQDVSKARNAALDAITGKYVIFLDSDDWIENNAIEVLVDLQLSNQNFLISSDRYFAYYDDKGRIYKKRQRTDDKIMVVGKEEAICNIGTGKYNLQSACYKIFDKKKIKNIRFNTNIFHGEDGLFVFEYLRNCSGLVFSTEPLWNILERPGSATTSPYNKNWLTAIKAAEMIYKIGNKDGIISDSLGLYLVDRIEMVENAALRSCDGNIDDIKYVRSKLKNNMYLLRKANYKVKIKYIIYAYAPIFLLRELVLFIGRIKR